MIPKNHKELCRFCIKESTNLSKITDGDEIFFKDLTCFEVKLNKITLFIKFDGILINFSLLTRMHTLV